MKRINKVILGIAAGSLTLLSNTIPGNTANASKGYSQTDKTEITINYQDQEVYLAQNIQAQPTAKPSAKPTPTPESKPSVKPTPTYAAKPTPTYAAKPTPTYAAKPTAKPSAKVTPTPEVKPSPKTLISNVANTFGDILSGIGKFFGNLFGK